MDSNDLYKEPFGRAWMFATFIWLRCRCLSGTAVGGKPESYQVAAIESQSGKDLTASGVCPRIGCSAARKVTTFLAVNGAVIENTRMVRGDIDAALDVVFDEFHPDVAFRIWTACNMERLMQAQLGILTDTAMKIMPRVKWMNLTRDRSVELKRGGYHLTS